MLFVYVHVGSRCFMAYTPQLVHVATVTLALFTETMSSVHDYTCVQVILLTAHTTNIILRE